MIGLKGICGIYKFRYWGSILEVLREVMGVVVGGGDKDRIVLRGFLMEFEKLIVRRLFI